MDNNTPDKVGKYQDQFPAISLKLSKGEIRNSSNICLCLIPQPQSQQLLPLQSLVEPHKKKRRFSDVQTTVHNDCDIDLDFDEDCSDEKRDRPQNLHRCTDPNIQHSDSECWTDQKQPNQENSVFFETLSELENYKSIVDGLDDRDRLLFNQLFQHKLIEKSIRSRKRSVVPPDDLIFSGSEKLFDVIIKFKIWANLHSIPQENWVKIWISYILKSEV